MNVDAIRNGIVLDHIRAGYGMRIYQLLHLESLDCPVAIMRNAVSRKLGRKDIIKIDADIPLDLDILGFVDPEITVNVIRDGVLTEKMHPALPERLTGVLVCKNPRCITTAEQELPQVFTLSDRTRRTYRCLYCEAEAQR